MHIQVLFDEISYENVCNYYNHNKPDNWISLQRLERAEGGFSIDIQNHQPDPNDIFSYDPNAKIKQLRWNKKCLICPRGYNGFNIDETQLLFESLCNVYGKDQVILHS